MRRRFFSIFTGIATYLGKGYGREKERKEKISKRENFEWGNVERKNVEKKRTNSHDRLLNWNSRTIIIWLVLIHVMSWVQMRYRVSQVTKFKNI